MVETRASAPDIPAYIDRDCLAEIKRNLDWRLAFAALGLQRDPQRSSDADWWAKSPFKPDERTASFHMNADPQGGARWYCHATHQGGGIIDLVQKLQNSRTVFEAGRWLLEQHCSHLETGDSPALPPSPMTTPAQAPEKESGEKEKQGEGKVNRPVRQSLLHALRPSDPEGFMAARDLSPELCAYLGCGYLPDTHKSSLRNRVVFQVRGVVEIAALEPKRVIYTHIGRAITGAQAEADGKWAYYKGFHKTLELYNLDNVRLDPEAVRQIEDTKTLWLVEGCFDVARLVQAGQKNVVAAFGAHLSPEQIEKLHQLKEVLRIPRIGVWFDRDDAGRNGQTKALDTLKAENIPAIGFDWDQSFFSPSRGSVAIPETISDPGDFTAEQIRWLKSKGAF